MGNESEMGDVQGGAPGDSTTVETALAWPEMAAELRRLDHEVYAAKAADPVDAERLAAARARRHALLEVAAAASPREVAGDDPAAAEAAEEVPAVVRLVSGLREEAAVLAAADVAALEAEAGDEDEDDEEPDDEEHDDRLHAVAVPSGIPALQGSLAGDRLIFWAGAHGTAPAGPDDLQELISEAGAGPLAFSDHPGLRIPGGAVAAARSVDLGSSLGWLVAVAAGHVGHDAGPSIVWLGRTALLACDLVARGQVVPTLEAVPSPTELAGPAGTFIARWLPVPGTDARRLGQLAARMPETVAIASGTRDRTAATNAVLAAMVDAICRAGASRLGRPGTSVVARSLPTASDAFLAGLGNGPFRAEIPVARELTGRLTEWARPALEGRGATLLVRLAAPDELGAWRLRVFVIDGAGHRLPLATARARGNPRQQRAVRAELDRLVHLVPALGRTSGAEALLGNEEAWELMTETAPLLEGAGFAVQVPSIARSAPSARLRLDASPDGAPSVVGTAQLTQVRWSAVVDDVELTPARHLAASPPRPARSSNPEAAGSRSTTTPSANWRVPSPSGISSAR